MRGAAVAGGEYAGVTLPPRLDVELERARLVDAWRYR